MSGAVFTLRTADGRTLRGRVQGSGGEIGASLGPCWASKEPEFIQRALDDCRRRLEALPRILARTGKLNVYEPAPGCVKLYIGEFKPSEAEETVEVVPVAGLVVVRVDPPAGAFRG